MTPGDDSVVLFMDLPGALFLQCGRKECWMGVFRAYYDASRDDDALTVVGLITERKRWGSFCRYWIKALKDFGVPYLHMKTFVPGLAPYESWREDSGRREEFIQRLISVLHHNVEMAWSFGLNFRDFKEINKQYKLSERYGTGGRSDLAGAYSFCAGSCTLRVQRWFDKEHPNNSLLHIFEAGDQGGGALQQHLSDCHIRAVLWPKADPKTGDWLPPFQGSDLWAWFDRRVLSSRVRSDPSFLPLGNLGNLYRSLVGRVPHHPAEFQDKEALIAICETHPDEFPQRSAPGGPGRRGHGA
jgi:hypothetical protein